VDVLLVQEAGIGAAAAGLLVLLLPLQACRHRCGGSNVVMDATDRSSSVQLGLLAFGRRERSAARNTAGSWAVGGRRMACEKRPLLMAGPGNNPAQGFPTWLLQYCITIGSEATFLSALCVIRCPSNLIWSRTFLLGVGRNLVRLRDLVGAPRGRIGLFFSPPWPWWAPGGDQPPSGVVGGGPHVTRRCHRRCRADLCPWPGCGGRFFPGGYPQR
jgi:hypothetical protein